MKLLWQHDPGEPIGNVIDIYENDVGLYITARLLLSVQKAKDVYLMLKAGTIDGLSIGYIPIKYDTDNETGARVLKQVELWEVSLVTFPANSDAQVVNVKSQSNEQEMLVRAIEKANEILIICIAHLKSEINNSIKKRKYCLTLLVYYLYQYT